MKELNNIELDLLFRIDFFALTGFGGNGFVDDEKFETQKTYWKNKYSFVQYYNYLDFEFVRMSEVEENYLPYLDYLLDINSKSKFDCCQLEQVIGIFELGELQVVLATDSGLCYNSQAHFSSVEEIFRSGESDLMEVNNFYGKIQGDFIELLYSSTSNNINIDKTKENKSFKLKKVDFELKLRELKRKLNRVFKILRQNLKLKMTSKDEKEFIDEVFYEIKKV